MDLLTAIKERKSIRAFKPDPVPKETVEEILRLSIRAPSAINLQPWEFHVVMGEERERLSRRLIKAFREKQIPCGPGTVKPFLEEMKVQSDQFINEGSCNFYGAPTAILIFQDDAFSRGSYVDIGIVLGYFVLAAHSFGLGTCPIGLINAYADEVKDLLTIPENKNLIAGAALGHPDWESPINRFKSYREDLEKVVRWVE